MKFVRAGSFALAAVLLAAPAAQAQQPAFAGSWAMDPSRSDSAKQAEPIAPTVLVISQTPSQLVIEKRQGDASDVVKYALDGSETVSDLDGNKATPNKATGSLRIQQDQLVTETLYEISGVPMRQSQVFSLSADGREMTVESALIVIHGYEGSNTSPLASDSNRSTGKDIFRKAG